jgi:hypothetical protein
MGIVRLHRACLETVTCVMNFEIAPMSFTDTREGSYSLFGVPALWEFQTLLGHERACHNLPYDRRRDASQAKWNTVTKVSGHHSPPSLLHNTG